MDDIATKRFEGAKGRGECKDVGREKNENPAPAGGNLTPQVDSRARARAQECENPTESPPSPLFSQKCAGSENFEPRKPPHRNVKCINKCSKLTAP
jgi:hypothetical protein